MKIAFIIDSTAGIENPELLNHPDIYTVDLSIIFDEGQSFTDTNDPKTLKTIYDTMTKQKTLPTTSQPSLGDYDQLIKHIIKKGYDGIIAIHLSSALSGTYQSAHMILNEYNDQIKTACIDSKGTSVVMLNLLESGLHLIKSLSFEDTVKQLQQLVEDSHIYILVGSLDTLVKGGRLSQGAALVGQFLRIQPLLKVQKDGSVEISEKIRTRCKAKRRYVELVKKYVDAHCQPVRVFLAHAQNEKEMYEVKEIIESKLPFIEVELANLTPVVGVHLGAKSLGLGLTPCILPKKINKEVSL